MNRLHILLIVVTVLVLGVAVSLLTADADKAIAPEEREIADLEEQVPESLSVEDNLDTMSSEVREEFERTVESMKSFVVVENVPMPVRATVVATGKFTSRAYTVKGEAVFLRQTERRILYLDNFKTVNGPDLNIYLANDLSDENVLDLGNLRATEGSISYALPADLDIVKYNKVLIWSESYGVLFGYAELK